MSSDHPLPKGANGLDLGELVLALARDKLIFTPKGAREHYTLHLGPYSRVIDVHKTTLREDGTEEHLTLFSITHERLLAMLEALNTPFLELLMSLARPLNPAWMEKRRVGVIVGLLPTGKESPPSAEFAAASLRSIRRNSPRVPGRPNASMICTTSTQRYSPCFSIRETRLRAKSATASP